MLHYRPTWAEINLKNLDYNLRLVKKLVGPKVKILVPVKSDAYGHGIVAIAKRLEALGIDYLGVASIDEGIALREASITKPILILSTVLSVDVQTLFDYRLVPTVCTKELAFKLNSRAKQKKMVMPIHIKVDTGMHRVGVAHADAFNFIKEIASLKHVKIEGVFTHFPCADNKPSFTRKQIALFEELVKRLKTEGIDIALTHTSNSMGVIGYPEGNFAMVRPGLMLYGLYPKDNLEIRLKPLLGLKTKIIFIKTVPKGKGISYGHTYVTSRKMTVATLPIGYGDGYPRSLSNKAYCLINGKKAKIIGRVCMDQLMVDVTKIKKVRVGQEVVLIGKQKKESISVEQLAKLAGTIPYEIVCNLGGRIKRVYRERGTTR